MTSPWNELTLSKILFLDIETVGQRDFFENLNEQEKALWGKKSVHISKEDPPLKTYEKAGIYAEFGKIVCISVGFLNFQNKEFPEIRLKSFCGEEEDKIIIGFFKLLETHFNTTDSNLCAHNGKEFDYPYLCRRALILGIGIPDILQIQDKKPWEIRLLDTLQMWKFGDYKSYTSLELLAYVLNIPSPKDEIDGSMVHQAYWTDKNLELIQRYCEKDVITLSKVFLSLIGQKKLAQNLSLA